MKAHLLREKISLNSTMDNNTLLSKKPSLNLDLLGKLPPVLGYTSQKHVLQETLNKPIYSTNQIAHLNAQFSQFPNVGTELYEKFKENDGNSEYGIEDKMIDSLSQHLTEMKIIKAELIERKREFSTRKLYENLLKNKLMMRTPSQIYHKKHNYRSISRVKEYSQREKEKKLLMKKSDISIKQIAEKPLEAAVVAIKPSNYVAQKSQNKIAFQILSKRNRTM